MTDAPQPGPSPRRTSYRALAEAVRIAIRADHKRLFYRDSQLKFASGLALGASRTPRDVMLKDASPPGQIGKVFGFVSAGLPLGSALTPVPFGMLIDRHHPELVLILVAALLLASLLCMGSARASARGDVLAVAAE